MKANSRWPQFAASAVLAAATAAVLATASTANGAVVPTTADNNSFDLASSATYSGGSLPATGDTVRLVGANTWTCSADMTFAQFYFSASGQTIDLSATPSRTITLGGTTCFYPWGSGRSLSLVGGTYYALAKGIVNIAGEGVSRMSLSGGVVVTNAGDVAVRKKDAADTAGAALSLAGAGTLFETAGDFRDYYNGEVAYPYTADPAETGVGLDISHGARLLVSAKTFQPSGVALVRGDGSSLEVAKDYAYIGLQLAGTILHVTDGATFTAGGTTHIPNNAANGGNHLRVDDGATASLQTVYLGSWNAYGHDNWLEAGPGGTITTAGELHVAGTNNHVVVSNGTLSVASCNIGCNPTDRGHELRVYGASASLTHPSLGLVFGQGSGHRFSIDGGAAISIPGDFYFARGGTDAGGTNTANTVEVENGATLAVGRHILFRNYNGDWVAANGNTLRVASGGRVTCADLRLRSIGNTVCVSNGTIICSGEFICGGEESGNNGLVVATSGGRVILEGSTPRIEGAGACRLNDGVTLVFRSSESGFTTESALLSFPGFATDGTASLAFEGLEALVRELDAATTYTLAEATGANGRVAFTDAQIAAANAALPEGCRVAVSADGKSLVLKVSPIIATTLVVR
ncbi:MAG: hypothetical protein IJP66_06585 [Kiritimatiellae bacterium]|nr:hypothetical protein [Kiritimatiellia bacterium]